MELNLLEVNKSTLSAFFAIIQMRGIDMISLKRTTIDDVDLLLKMDKQKETQMYLGGVKNKSREERIEFLKKKELNSNNYTVYLNNSIKIGFIGLKKIPNYYELSYIFDSDYTNKGYCSKAIEILLKDYKDIKIIAKFKKENTASIRVLEKNGFMYKDKDEDDFLIYEK